MTAMFGEFDTNVRRRRHPSVLWEDNFNEGPCGWTQLMEGTLPTGPLVLDSEITYDNSRYSLLLGTEDYTAPLTRPWGSAMAIKRMARGPSVGKVYVEWVWAWGNLWGQDNTRVVNFGIDQADPTGLRKFFKLRWQNYDDQVTNSRVTQYKLLTADGTYVDIPGAKIDHGYNENKRNQTRLEAVFDVGAGVYDGMRVDGQGFGSLAATPDNSMRAFSPPPETLKPFSKGFNVILELYNRLNTANSKSWVNLTYSRGVAL